MKRLLIAALAALLALGPLPAAAEAFTAPVEQPVADAADDGLFTSDAAAAEAKAELEDKATGVEIVRANFPDRAFRRYVMAHFDANGNGRLSRAERGAVTEIDACALGIGSLKGIGFFPNLTSLRVSGNNLKKLDLSGNPQLMVLDCAGNRLTRLNVSKNNALETLCCQDNGLTKLTLGRCAGLNVAYLQGNALETVSISYCPLLRALTMALPREDAPDMDGAVCFGDPELIRGGVLVIDADTQLTQRRQVVYPRTEPTQVALDRDMLRALPGDALTLTPTIEPSNASTTFTWKSSRKGVAKVKADGTVRVIGPGVTTITVTTDNGLTASCTLNVARGGIINVAHRGGAGYWPENTLEAFRNAASTGADDVELDVQTTSDGVQVVNHNEFIVSGGRRYYIQEQTLDRLRALKPDLCTLAEALEVIRDSGLQLQLELKRTSRPAACVKLVRKYGMRRRTTYISFEADLLAKVRALDPAAQLGYIFTSAPGNLPDIISRLRLYALLQGRNDLTPENLAAWREAGLLVGVWTVDEDDEIRRWLDLGVDFITSNYPRAVTHALRQ